MKTSADVIPYLNITANLEDKPDQGMLEKKGGRGFPFAAIMNADGDVLYEVRPTSKSVFDKALANSGKIVALKAKVAKDDKDAASAAALGILEAIGCQQRPSPELEKLDMLAKTEGIDAAILAEFKSWRIGAKIQGAFQGAKSEGEVAERIYAMMKEGDLPQIEDDMALAFYYFSSKGALAAKDKERAKTAIDGFAKAVEAQEGESKDRMMEDVEKFRAELKGLTEPDKN